MMSNAPRNQERKKELLMVFSKNPDKGKVKTRLAKGIGEENALRVYKELLQHTARVVAPLEVDKRFFFSERFPEKDPFGAKPDELALQGNGELGQRMAVAFEGAFKEGYERVAIIGTDCYELTSEILKEAFQALRYEQEVVLGPAWDGGYYLLGMTRYIERLFQDKNWGGANVFLDSLNDLKEEGLQYHLLPTLHDVDEEEDLGELRSLLLHDRSEDP